MATLWRTWDRGLRVTPALAALAALLACAPTVGARGEATATFRVTLNAQLTKTWDYVDTRQANNCTIISRVRGRRTVTIASSRPTVVRVSTVTGRPRFSPAAVRFVTARAAQGGSVDTTERGASCSGVTHTDCVRVRRTVANQTLGFLRSGRNELSFRRGRDFSVLPSTCPPEDEAVREERPALHKAEGEISERDLFNRGVRAVTAGGVSEETADLEGGPTGKVVARTSWVLTFRRA